ncbi:hypothetical protein, partial [Aneurinibacillus migulanus]|uniref:hypothetical protein n=1 Tax=Aneurinibacillus migulanus TaxID=47500 RepID=UPI001F46830A
MYAVRVILFYPSMDTKGVDCSERKRLPQRDTNKAFRLPLRVCPDVLRSRLARAESGPLCFRAGDE